MKEVDVSEAKNSFASLLDQVEKGEEILITRHGKPVARLVPNIERIDRTAAEAAVARIHSRAKAIELGHFEWERFKRDRDSGRP